MLCVSTMQRYVVRALLLLRRRRYAVPLELQSAYSLYYIEARELVEKGIA